ncbi:YggS family pyridoxal phosphate-dependent enzyme [Candidatus Pelagibacter sp.]|nr:YggS family pyridoxal phosphate-dependent enzyme [Candidatus Pelagibacter sp.]
MHKIINNLEEIKDKLNQLKSDLSENVRIIAVSKTFLIEDIKPLIEYGHEDFGENKIQEAINKWSDIKNKNPKLKLHMVGKIQTNKVKFLLPLFDYIHSLDNLKLAQKISDEEIKKKKKLKIFIQVNIDDESQKSGISIENLNEFYLRCINDLNLNIIGLMCLPSQNKNPTDCFLLLKKLAKDLNIFELSMGMSNDYEQAIKCGSTYIRVGSNIFGKRT